MINDTFHAIELSQEWRDFLRRVEAKKNKSRYGRGSFKPGVPEIGRLKRAENYAKKRSA